MAKAGWGYLGCVGVWALGFAVLGCSSMDAEADSLAASPPGDYGPGTPAADPTATPTTPSPTATSAAGEGAAGTGALAPGVPGATLDLALPPRDPVTVGNGNVQPGTLTAGAWDDNRNLERFLDYRAEVWESQDPALLAFAAADHEAAFAALPQAAAKATLDISLVIDTTGSMGDELGYLQKELEALSAAIEAEYPSAEQRWSLVVYRDVGDEYVTRTFDFEGNAIEFREHLDEQESGGGGDYPEAADAALAAMNQLSWRSTPDTARLAFWVADAPHHPNKKDQLKQAILSAQGQGVHLYPVASSGVDELTELSMRSAAQLTGGRYLFLTDDSGVGGVHKEPSIPCYFVTKLDDAILRMVEIEMTGAYREPTVADIVRVSGDLEGGACTLESGEQVFAF